MSNVIMLGKFPILLFCSILFIIFLTGASFKKEPVLDNNLLPGYYLQNLEYETQKISDLSEDDPRYNELKNTTTVEILIETWMTISNDEYWNNWFDKKKRKNNLKTYNIQLERYYLESNKDALEWAKIRQKDSSDIKSHNEKSSSERWSEGGFRAKKIGDICWNDKNSNYRTRVWKGNGLSICFVKGNIYVEITGTGPENNPMDPSFVEKIAQMVEKRL